jgi:hypothetical protein
LAFKEEFVRRESETLARGIALNIPFTEHRDCAQNHREALRRYFLLVIAENRCQQVARVASL